MTKKRTKKQGATSAWMDDYKKYMVDEQDRKTQTTKKRSRDWPRFFEKV